MNHLDLLGKLVKDATSGFEGIVIQTLEQMSGNIQIAIQPQVKADATGIYPEAMFIDYHMIDVTGEGVSARVTKVPTPSAIKLGQRVKDVATDFTGIAYEKATYINGCEAFSVLPKAVKTDLINGNSSPSWIAATRVVLVDDGILPKVVVPPKAADGKAPGGPAQRVMNR
jgi:hypothetical protein